ncbi:MAG: lipoyl(octanoyl) transferase LipB [Alphaproteobacteria bacterium]|nr:lipoyl(octanoyl) transferase LipB [Alphaproteobacteria bacterium]
MLWISQNELVGYETAVSEMERRVAGIHAGTDEEAVWLVEHPPLYTAGSSANPQDLLNPRFPVFETGRGGQYTYHGPGQRVAYVMLDLKKRQKEPDIRKYVWQLEEWIIQTLSELGIKGERRDGRIGIWVIQGGEEKKIAAIGVRVRHWVTYHGIAINVNPDLSHFSGIIPCGLKEFGVTKIQDICSDMTIHNVDSILRSKFGSVF